MAIPSAPPRPSPVRRVILVVADGLRPDVIPLLDLPVFGRLIAQGASTLSGKTVRPSVTAAAMGSLLTGVDPRVHGLTSDRFRIPRPAGPVDPLPLLLRDAGIPTAAWMARLPWMYRRLGRTIARRLGFDSVTFQGENAREILEAARRDLASRGEGLLVMHWPDGDRAGHENGWPSPAYLRSVCAMDRTLGELLECTNAADDSDTLLVVLADHGGGGTTRREHDADHALNRTIPIVLAGGRVVHATLLPDCSVLDIAPTVLSQFGRPIPGSYSGRALSEAFVTPRMARHQTLSATRFSELAAAS